MATSTNDGNVFVSIPVAASTETTIDEVLDESLVEKIMDSWDEEVFGPTLDFGGGIKGVDCGMMLTALSLDVGRKKTLKLSAKERKEIVSLCEMAKGREPYA